VRLGRKWWRTLRPSVNQAQAIEGHEWAVCEDGCFLTAATLLYVASLTLWLLRKLQSVQNAAARLLTQTGRREHITLLSYDRATVSV